MIAPTRDFVTVNHGNTNTSIYFHTHQSSYEIKEQEYFNNKKFQAMPGAISSVGKKRASFPLTLKDIKKSHQKKKFLDMKIQYTEDLGADRLINAYYIYKKEMHQKEKVLHIDAGTFMTIDFISTDGFEGGFIFPGESTYLQSFSFGENLPLLDHSPLQISSLIPKSTKEAIGNSFSLFIKGIFTEIIQTHSPLKFILTGGGRKKIESILIEKKIHFTSMPLITHQALKLYYLNLQKENQK